MLYEKLQSQLQITFYPTMAPPFIKASEENKRIIQFLLREILRSTRTCFIEKGEKTLVQEGRERKICG